MKTIPINITFTLLLTLVFLGVSVFAQEEIVLKDLQNQLLIQKYEQVKSMSNNEAVNQVYVSQIGDQNQSILIQDAAYLSGANAIYLLQSGNYNVSHALQKGYSNNLQIIQQGDANQTAIVAEGELLRMVTAQYGDGNQIEQQVSGTSSTYKLSQYGNNNTIEQKGDTFSKGISITQYGNNMNISVEQITLFK